MKNNNVYEYVCVACARTALRSSSGTCLPVKCVVGGKARCAAVGVVVKCIGYLKAVEVTTITITLGGSRTCPLMSSCTAFQPTGRDAKLTYPSVRLLGVLN